MTDDPAAVVRVLEEGRAGTCEACLEVLTGFPLERLRAATDVLLARAQIAMGRGTCTRCKIAGPAVTRLRR